MLWLLAAKRLPCEHYFQGAPYPAMMLSCHADPNTCLAGPQCSAELQGRIAP